MSKQTYMPFEYGGITVLTEAPSDNKDPVGAKEENILFARDTLDTVRRKIDCEPWGANSYTIAKKLGELYDLEDGEIVGAWIRHYFSKYVMEKDEEQEVATQKAEQKV